jgi:hypothetical protein
LLGDVFDGDDAFEYEITVNHQQAFKLVFVQQSAGFCGRGAVGLLHGDELVTRRHDLADGHVVTGFKAQIAAGDDADNFATIAHREARNAQLVRQIKHLAHGVAGGNDDRVA